MPTTYSKFKSDIMAITFPNIDPVIFQIGFFSVRWYALAYIVGLFGGLKYVEHLIAKRPVIQNFTKNDVESLFTYVALGVILGGRFGYVLFYKFSYYLDNPSHILRVWEGGMSFHGGLLGVMIAIILFARKRNLSILTVGDYVAPAVPIGLFFGRIANFINAELYGRETSVPWGVRFPDPYYIGQYLAPRHASQIYEALAEGLLLFIILHFTVYKTKCLEYHGKITGIFLSGYALARIICEFFREPDSFLGFVFQIEGIGLTQGMILSVPMLLLGIFLIINARKNYVPA